jgi:hypothetical protein
MGVDIYLNSIWKPWFKAHKAELRNLSAERIIAWQRDPNAIFDFYRSSGGYFHNGYNAGDVTWAMGMDWRDVGALLDKKRRLPTKRACELVAKIKACPLTRERVGQHIYQHMTNGMDVGAMRFARELIGDISEVDPPDFDVLFPFLNKRRDELLAIVRSRSS